MIENRSKTAIAAFSGLLLISAVNWFAHTPVIFVGTVVSFLALILSAWKFDKSFDARLFFKKSSGRNYWNAAFTGVLTFTFGIIISIDISPVEGGFAEVMAVITGLTVHSAFLMTLFYGSILQDIKNGDTEITRNKELETSDKEKMGASE